MKQLFFVILLVFLISIVSAEVAGDASSDQFLINKTMLFSDGDQNVRVVAAKQLLLSDKTASRELVLNILNSDADAKAKTAIFLAIIESDNWSRKIPNADELAVALCKAITVDDPEVSNLGCQALSMFDYSLIGPTLVKIVSDESNPIHVRLNAINGLKASLPNRDVIPELVKLLDNPNPQISQAADEALQEWVPLGKDKKIWRQVISDLGQKTPEQIVKERLLRQEAKLRQLNIDMEKIRAEHLAVLEDLYQFKTVNNGRKEFLLEQLKSSQPKVRLWALDKVSQWKNSTKLPDEFSPVLIAMIADNSWQVRSSVADLLVYMGDIAPAKALLSQLNKELNDYAAISELNALSEACYYASISNGKVVVDKSLRIAAIGIAEDFLQSSNKLKVVAGAKSFARMIEKNGVGEEVVSKGLSLVRASFDKAVSDNDDKLILGLLKIMASLCQNSNYYNGLSAKAFHDSFSKYLESKSVEIKIAAMNGLINIDSTAALHDFKNRKFYEYPDPRVVSTVVSLAGKVGQSGDLDWLSGILSKDSDQAWDSILKILSRSNGQIIWKWLETFEKMKVPVDRLVQVLNISEKKPGFEVRSKLRLARIYTDKEDNAIAVKYYESALNLGLDPATAQKVNLELLKYSLSIGNISRASEILAWKLGRSDIIASKGYGKAVDAYFTDKYVDSSAKLDLYKRIVAIKTPTERLSWKGAISRWKIIVDRIKKESAKPKSTTENTSKDTSKNIQKAGK